MNYVIYTDGAYSPSTNKGGIGFIVLKDEQEIFSYCKSYKNTTNQRMELRAAIMALESINVKSDIKIISDSMYLVGTMNQGWKKKANKDLWERLEKAIKRHNTVTFEWCKGHNNNVFNNKVDELATNASKFLTL